MNVSATAASNNTDEMISKIDGLNEEAWRIRVTEPARALALSTEAKSFSEECGYRKGLAYAIRNMIIVGIVLLSLFVLLIFNRKSLKAKMKIEKMAQEKLLMEQEVASAKDQLKLFTENVIEKTSLIEKLEMQVKGKEVTSEQHSIISELTQQTILTEQDWYKFRSLFEKIYPGFFIKLKDRFPDITVAEQRMAALTRLHLTTKQIASMKRKK